jgi:hypothetical protein
MEAETGVICRPVATGLETVPVISSLCPPAAAVSEKLPRLMLVANPDGVTVRTFEGEAFHVAELVISAVAPSL